MATVRAGCQPRGRRCRCWAAPAPTADARNQNVKACAVASARAGWQSVCRSRRRTVIRSRAGRRGGTTRTTRTVCAGAGARGHGRARSRGAPPTRKARRNGSLARGHRALSLRRWRRRASRRVRAGCRSNSTRPRTGSTCRRRQLRACAGFRLKRCGGQRRMRRGSVYRRATFCARAQAWDPVSKARAQYRDRPDPSFRTYGPRTRRELWAMLREGE